MSPSCSKDSRNLGSLLARGGAKLMWAVWEELMATLICLPPSALHWSMANKFKRRGILLSKRRSSPPATLVTPLITSLGRRRKGPSPPCRRLRPHWEAGDVYSMRDAMPSGSTWQTWRLICGWEQLFLGLLGEQSPNYQLFWVGESWKTCSESQDVCGWRA